MKEKFSSTSELQPTEVKRRLEALRMHQDVEAKKLSEKVKSQIEEFEPTVLLEIFSEFLRKANVEDSADKFVTFDKFVFVHEPHSKSMGKYSPKVGGGEGKYQGVITINTAYYKDAIQLLWSLVHEELHALTDNGNSAWNGRKIGLRNMELSGSGALLVKFKGIDEGVTELLVDRIVHEYLRRTGYLEREDLKESHKNLKDERFTRGLYSDYMLDAEDYIQTIAELAEIDSEVVEGAVFRTYFNNGEILPKELTKELNLPASVIEELSRRFSRSQKRGSDSTRDILKRS